ncbi:MAG: PQQ-dependent sugar dehydrogenase [Ilumatobacteraceae bacterium]
MPTTTAPTAASVQPTSTTPPDPASIAMTDIASVEGAVDLAFRADDPTLFVVSRSGFVVALRNGVVDDTRLLDITGDISAGGEQGLLGLAFSLDGRHAYVDYSNKDGDTEIVEYAVGVDGVFDPTSKRRLLEIDQPHANHNGGQVRIGTDGYLYIGMGDGGSANDPDRRALDLGQLLGKMLRIDPTASGDSPYSIPPDNPFVGVDGARPEIWSIGLRNPWRFSFDRITNDLWIADVGQGEWEEIDAAWADAGSGRGANFGWSAFEGTHRFNDDQSADGSTPPIWEYEHGDAGCSVSGGVRYRGSALPTLYGYYVYGDYCSGQVRALEILDTRTADAEVVLATLSGISEVAQGPDGELYVLSVEDGIVYAVQAAN